MSNYQYYNNELAVRKINTFSISNIICFQSEVLAVLLNIHFTTNRISEVNAFSSTMLVSP